MLTKRIICNYETSLETQPCFILHLILFFSLTPIWNLRIVAQHLFVSAGLLVWIPWKSPCERAAYMLIVCRGLMWGKCSEIRREVFEMSLTYSQIDTAGKTQVRRQDAASHLGEEPLFSHYPQHHSVPLTFIMY